MEGFGQFLPIILLFTAMYFLFLLPQSRKAKKEKQFVSNIKNGDRVVTKSGMHGKIVEIKPKKQTVEPKMKKRKTKGYWSALMPIGTIEFKGFFQKNIFTFYLLFH